MISMLFFVQGLHFRCVGLSINASSFSVLLQVVITSCLTPLYLHSSNIRLLVRCFSFKCSFQPVSSFMLFTMLLLALGPNNVSHKTMLHIGDAKLEQRNYDLAITPILVTPGSSSQSL